MDAGIIGGTVGGVIGVLGGIIGTYFSITNTDSPRERQFMVKASVICWLSITLFLALLFILPNPYRWFAWIPYGIFLPLGISAINKGIARIKAQEMAESSSTPPSQ